MENMIQLDEMKGFIRRRRRLFLIVFLSVVFIAVIIALALPPYYLSESTILIESQQIPQDYVKSAITTYVEERLQTITHRIMSRSQLKEIIDQFGLYSDYKDRYTSEEIITKMRDDIKFETISAEVTDQRTGRETKATIAFSLSFEGKDPATVQKVANILASLYLEENMKSREEQVTNTTTFLEQQLAEIQSKIDQIQEQISTFKSKHYSELPENDSMNLNFMMQLEREFDQNNAQILSLKERKIFLESQLANIDPLTSLKTDDGQAVMNEQDRLRYLRLELNSLRVTYKDTHPDIRRIEKTIEDLESRIDLSDEYTDTAKRLEELTNERAVMEETLTLSHPDMVRINKEIETLYEELKEAEMEQVMDNIGSQSPDNPAYINIQTQIETAEMDIQSLLKEQEGIKEEIGVYQERLANSPVIEKEYNNLTRDYENAKYKYNEIMDRLMEARVSQGMEETQRGERFTIIDNAQLPEKPYKPNRRAITFLGFFLGVIGAVVLTTFQEAVDDSFKTSRDLAEFLEAPVISEMPLIVTKGDRRRRSIRRSAIGVGALCVIGLAIVLIHIYVMPMEMLMVKIQNRMMGI